MLDRFRDPGETGDRRILASSGDGDPDQRKGDDITICVTARTNLTRFQITPSRYLAVTVTEAILYDLGFRRYKASAGVGELSRPEER